MKSLMEEASSISKAIENGWTNAGKPKEFTVKIFEEPEKNFFGFTSKPAKIGIFFTEPKKAEEKRKKPKKERSKPPREKVAPKKPEELGPIWDDEMINSTNEWVGALLQHMGLNAPYTVTPSRFHLRVEFTGSVLADKDRQKHLFAVLSGLIMTMLKRKYKRPLRGYKIVLTEV